MHAHHHQTIRSLIARVRALRADLNESFSHADYVARRAAEQRAFAEEEAQRAYRVAEADLQRERERSERLVRQAKAKP